MNNKMQKGTFLNDNYQCFLLESVIVDIHDYSDTIRHFLVNSCFWYFPWHPFIVLIEV